MNDEDGQDEPPRKRQDVCTDVTEQQLTWENVDSEVAKMCGGLKDRMRQHRIHIISEAELYGLTTDSMTLKEVVDGIQHNHQELMNDLKKGHPVAIICTFLLPEGHHALLTIEVPRQGPAVIHILDSNSKIKPLATRKYQELVDVLRAVDYSRMSSALAGVELPQRDKTATQVDRYVCGYFAIQACEYVIMSIREGEVNWAGYRTEWRNSRFLSNGKIQSTVLVGSIFRRVEVNSTLGVGDDHQRITHQMRLAVGRFNSQLRHAAFKDP